MKMKIATYGMPGCLLMALLGTAQIRAGAETIAMPAQAYFNVADFGAGPNDTVDDTKAIQRALVAASNSGKYVFFPKGVYRVGGDNGLDRSGPGGLGLLVWIDKYGKRQNSIQILGEEKSSTRIVLRDSSLRFGDADHPFPLFYMAANDGHADGSGVSAMRNSIRNLTLEMGKGNPGSVAVDFICNNLGGLRDVDIRAPYGGSTGVKMTRTASGPCLLSGVYIEGFRYGLRVENRFAGITIENLRLKGQGVAGIENDKNNLYIRGLESENAVPVLRNNHPGSMVAIIGADFKGGSPRHAAIENGEYEGQVACLYLRNVSSARSTYRCILETGENAIAGPFIDEFVTNPLQATAFGLKRSLCLPIRDAPVFNDTDPKQWADVTEARYGAVADEKDDGRDDAISIQKAIDSSGRNTILIPCGTYYLRSTVHVRGEIRRLIGSGTTLLSRLPYARGQKSPAPMFRIESSKPDITIENLDVNKNTDINKEKGFTRGAVVFEHASKAALVLKSIQVADNYCATYKAMAGAGRVFIEDVSTQNKDDQDDTSSPSQWYFSKGQEIWARQFNVECNKTKVINDGARLWILGYKSERRGTDIETRNGGETELLGGLIAPYDLSPLEAENQPAFISIESRISLIYGDFTTSSIGGYRTTHIRVTKGGKTSVIKKNTLTERRGGPTLCRSVSLFSGF